QHGPERDLRQGAGARPAAVGACRVGRGRATGPCPGGGRRGRGGARRCGLPAADGLRRRGIGRGRLRGLLRLIGARGGGGRGPRVLLPGPVDGKGRPAAAGGGRRTVGTARLRIGGPRGAGRGLRELIEREGGAPAAGARRGLLGRWFVRCRRESGVAGRGAGGRVGRPRGRGGALAPRGGGP